MPVRHKVVGIAFLLGLVLYLDRAAISVAGSAIRRDLNLGPMAMGAVFAAFVWGYALLNIPVGWLADRYGARRVLTIIVMLWSAFTAATAWARGFASLLLIRGLFGAAEAGATPTISASFARWIPVAERARAQGIYFAGMSAGVALAPPLVAFGVLHWGWRSTFEVLGVIGVAWGIGWYAWYRDDPADHRGVGEPELRDIPRMEQSRHAERTEWRRILGSANVWSILLMYFTYGYTGYIYITWFPVYLTEARHLPLSTVGILAAAPGLLGVAAKPLGGWASDLLTARYSVVFGRRLVGMLGFGLAALSVIPALYIGNPYAAGLLLAVGDGAAALAHGVCFAVCIDIGMRRAGTLSALMLAMGSLGNAASALAFGTFLEYTQSWIPPFLIGVAANAIGALLWLKINPKERLI